MIELNILFCFFLNFFLFSQAQKYDNLNIQHINKDIINKIIISKIKTPQNLKENIINNNLFKLRKLEDTSSISIIVNGPKENVKILYDSFTLPNHVYLNDDSEDLNQINTITLENEGPNKITMVWDTKLKTGLNMFNGCSSIISIDLSNFDISSNTTMNNMFLSCSSLSYVNLTNFNTKSVKNMNSMFKGCSSLISLDLSFFNTTLVTNMNNMFTGCDSLTFLDLSNFNTSSLKYMEKIFSDCFSLTSLDISNFDTKSITNMNGIFSNCSSLVNLNLSNFNTNSVENMNAMFKGCSSLENLYISNFNTNSVENMNDMFSGCESLLNLDLTNFDTSLVKNMNSMFKDCSSLTSLDLSSFNTNLVSNMEMMFYGCSSIVTLNLSNFYTLSLKTMDHMFNGCKSLISLDISHFNTTLVKNMGYIFKNCNNLKSIDLSNFDTSSVTNMVGMFYTCSSLESLDLSNCKTSLVKSMYEMFVNCINLEFVNLSNFNISSEANINRIFYNCSSLKSVDLTNIIVNDLNELFNNLDSITFINRTNDLKDNDLETESMSINNEESQEIIITENASNGLEKNEEEDTTKNIYKTEIILEQDTNIIEIKKYYNTNRNEIINKLDEIIQDKDFNKTYVIKGIDYNIFIAPINTYVEDSSVNIHLSECENKLKENNPSKNFTLLQMNIKNNNKNCLVDQVEYKIYDENKQTVDLSICNDVNIKIEYKITNSSLLNLEQIANFNKKGIDVFNINDTFFNDICYPYTDDDSNSDMILSDRVSDIYQNFSICGDNCEYDSFNIDKVVANCNCKIKNEINTEVKEGNFETSIESAFLDSNFGVIKCIKLVFSFKGKLKNAGFWIFGILTIFHIPTYFFYFINGINPLTSYIKSEMNSKGYEVKHSNIKKENELMSPRIDSTKMILTIPKETSQGDSENKQFPLKKKKAIKKIKRLNESNKDLNTKARESDNNSHKNRSKNMIIRDRIEKNYIIPEKYKSSRTLRLQRNNLVNKKDFDDLLIEPQTKKNKRKKYKKTYTNINNINTTTTDRINVKKGQEEIYDKKSHIKINREFPLILINANNGESHEILKSNHKLDIYNYDEAIKYEDRAFLRIFFIYLISKDNLLNIIFFNPPLELKPLRICVFIFNYACDLALNALFYLSQNISDKYHYTGSNKILFSLLNNLTKSLASTIVGFILLYFFQLLTQSSQTIINIFRKQEDLLKKDKKYKVDEKTKIKIKVELKKILKCLKIKIICFIIVELLFILFFFYYVTAFCQVYHNTQVSWLLDSLSSYIISFVITLILSFIFALLYKISINYKMEKLYDISLFIYS